ncbi:MAG: insulinase family protein, partial [Acidobacteriota bacterium]|nr:insulinase family protein [Acidobacteriota bacterium]
MNLVLSNNSLRKVLLVAWILTASQPVVSAQVPPEPEQSRLLNGLRVRLWTRPTDKEVLIKLRVHSGAAFDLAGKAGTMALLGDLLFPDPTTREYFTEEMQGRLNVTTNYDSMTITMQGRASEFERIIEILRTALVTTQLTPENVIKAREGRIKLIKETSISPSMLADRAIATRLFGDFPYGRPYMGTAESLERIDRGDLMLARERFLNPNNSSLVVIGGVQPNRALRALRQLLGAWRKSEQLVPATFRQPANPDSRPLIINAPADQSVEVRLAIRGLARQDTDTPAAALLASVARQRWEKLLPDLARKPVFVRHEAFVLPGMFVMGTTLENLLAPKALETAQEVLRSFARSPVRAAELEQAKVEVMALANKELSSPDGIASFWLDADTYGLRSPTEQVRSLGAVSPDDLQRVAGRLLRDGTLASILVGNSEVLKTQIERHGKVEIIGDIEPKAET